jgi:hypothetical protein
MSHPSDPLWASRDLLFARLPAFFHSPSLHSFPPSTLPVWFWRVDLSFLSWVESLVARAGDRLTADQSRSCDFVRSYVYASLSLQDGDPLPPLPSPPRLSGDDLLTDSISLYDVHCGPVWDGMLAHAQRLKIDPSGASTSNSEGKPFVPRRDCGRFDPKSL